MSFSDVIIQAGRLRRTVNIKLKAKKGAAPAQSIEFEPYSARSLGGKETFFCMDVQSHVCLNIDLTSILDVEMTGRSFKPKFPVSL